MPMTAIDTFGQLEPFNQTEWLLTNGLGGFAFGTVVGCNTRRYHGLLIAATKPPVGRVPLLSRFGASITVSSDALTAHVTSDYGEFVKEPAWWYGHLYPVETDRGQDDIEDLFTPGRFTHSFTGSATITFVAALEPRVSIDWDRELA